MSFASLCTLSLVFIFHTTIHHINNIELKTNLSSYSTLCVCFRCVRDGRICQGNLWRCCYSCWAHWQGMHHHHRWRRWDTLHSLLFLSIPFLTISFLSFLHHSFLFFTTPFFSSPLLSFLHHSFPFFSTPFFSSLNSLLHHSDSVAAVEKAGLADKMSHISTGTYA